MNLNNSNYILESDDMYEKDLFVSNVTDYLAWLRQIHAVEESEHSTLQNMLKASDEDCYLAIELIKLKKPKQDGNNIHS